MKLIFSIFTMAITIFVISCASSTPAVKVENPMIDDANPNMRHGWAIFSGPTRTVIDVNDEGSIARGKAVYVKNCQECHGQTGRGDGPSAKAKGLKPANLAAVSRVLPNHYMVMQINDGRKNGMPSWSDILDNQESWDVTNYLQSISKSKSK